MKRFFCVLGVIWLAVLLRITVFRNGCFSHGLLSGSFSWRGFAFYAELLREGNAGYFAYQFIGNLAWFAPAGFLTRLWRGRVYHAALAGLLLSAIVEAGQFILGSGLTEGEDLILNTIGALIGYGVGCLALRRRIPMRGED